MIRVITRWSRIVSEVIIDTQVKSQGFGAVPNTKTRTMAFQALQEVFFKNYSLGDSKSFNIQQLSEVKTEISRLSFEELLTCSSYFTETQVFYKVSDDLVRALWARLQVLLASEEIPIKSLIQISRNLLTYKTYSPEMDEIFGNLLKRQYLNMEDLSSLINLTFNLNKSTKVKLLSEALEKLSQRISHNYSPSSLLDCIEMCSKLKYTSSEANQCIEKLNSIIQNKVDIVDNNDYLRIANIYINGKGVHKSFLSPLFQGLSYGFPGNKLNLSMPMMLEFLNMSMRLINTKTIYINFLIRKSMINEIVNNINITDLNENYGEFFENLFFFSNPAPEKLKEILIEKYRTEKKISLSYLKTVICVFSHKISQKQIELDKEKIQSIRELSIGELLKVLNLSFFLKSPQQREFARKIQTEVIQM